MDAKKTAKEIYEILGGKENIASNAVCMTRLRVKVKNEVDLEKLKKVDGVLNVVNAETLQIILGPGKVNAVGDEFSKLSGIALGFSDSNVKDVASENKKTNKQNTIDKMNKVEKIRKNKINVYDATELSTSNLTKINARLRNELEYKRLIMQTKQINKEISDQKRSKLNKMLGSVISNVVVPAAYNAGKDILTSKIKKALSKRLGA